MVYPGRPTSEAGPDFQQAIIALPDGRLLRGDVELHLDESDWWAHGHSRDSAYNGVVLHVVLNRGRRAIKANGQPVLTLALGERVRAQARPSSQVLAVGRAPCQRILQRMADADLRDTLLQLARQRFRDKAALFEGELAIFEPEQVLYAGLMQALGYQRNRAPFRQLASMMPITVLSGLAEAQPAHTRPTFIEGLLLSMAGLAGPPPLELPRLSPTVWQLHGVRPHNQPTVRISAFAGILAQLLGYGLLDSLLEPLDALTQGEVNNHAVSQLRALWTTLLEPLGPQRIDEVAINVLLPFAFAWGETTCRYLLGETALAAFLAYPSAGPNQLTRYMQNDVLGSRGRLARGAAGHQALLHVWDQWCHDKTCALCPLGHPQRVRVDSRATREEEDERSG